VATGTQAVDVTREVASKAILKKKVKGNKEIVWGEMRVLQGFNHPYIVRPTSPRAIYLPPPSLHHASARAYSLGGFPCRRSSFTSVSSCYQNTTSVSSSPWAESSLNASASVDTSQSEMPWRWFGTFERFSAIGRQAPVSSSIRD
jgi:hypothetical protein